jgi:pilus assembly protein CpaF
MVNGPGRVLVERNGHLEPANLVFRDEEHLEHTIRRIAERVGRRLDYANPTLDAYLEDGSRVHAVLPPIAIDGASLSIRRFGSRLIQVEDLIAHGTLTPEMAYLLSAIVKGRLNVIISGPGSSCKTTTMNALASLGPSNERIVTIVEIAEMDLSRAHANVVRLQTRIPNVEGKGEITTRQLVREALRMRADRILVGEARGGEMVEVLQAMRCGHDGSMTTVHASGPEHLIERAMTLALFANLGMSDSALRRMIVDAIDVIIHIHRFPDGTRRIVRITEPRQPEADALVMHDVFTFEHEGYDEQGRVVGQFRFVQPSHYAPALARQGLDIPWDTFARRMRTGSSQDAFGEARS